MKVTTTTTADGSSNETRGFLVHRQRRPQGKQQEEDEGESAGNFMATNDIGIARRRGAVSRRVIVQLFLVSIVVVVVFGLVCVLQQHQQHHYRQGQQPTQQQERQQRRRLLSTTGANIDGSSVSFSSSGLSLFQISKEIETIGPTIFPPPTDIYYHNTNSKSTLDSNTEIVPLFQPVIGKRHHSKGTSSKRNKDAIFIFAAEYNLNTYILFISTLQDTGYVGDVVIAISKLDYNDQYIRSYLESFDDNNTDTNQESDDQRLNVIVYVLDGLQCYNAEMMPVDGMKGGMRVCNVHSLYGYKRKKSETDSDAIVPLNDPRPPRTVPTTRYELYWIWIQYYTSNSWIMLIDARDTIFQSNPFVNVPRRKTTDVGIGGKLYFFGENIDATRIGKSKKNAKWLLHSYGQTVVDSLKDKPTICSGSTMGEAIAIETYLRSMVNEFDETNVKLMGVDQGYHNYLYYSNKLSNSISSISSITVFDQGYAIINNLGAMRTKELVSYFEKRSPGIDILWRPWLLLSFAFFLCGCFLDTRCTTS